jgi:hypothetical protein
MAHHPSWSHPRLPITTSPEVPLAPTAALTCPPWAGNHLASSLSRLLAVLITATALPILSSHSTRHKTACTISRTTSAARTAPSPITTTPTRRGWAMRCGLPPFNRHGCLTAHLDRSWQDTAVIHDTQSGRMVIGHSGVTSCHFHL